MTTMDLRAAAWLARCTGRGGLAPFTPDEMDRLAETVGVRHVAADTPLMAAGGPVRAIGLIRSGEIALTRRHHGRRVVLQVLHADDLYGDIPFLCRMPPPFAARALTDTSVVELDADTFWQLLAVNPEICQRFLFSVASRLQRMQQRLLEVTAGDVRHRVASLLRDEAPGGGRVSLTQSTVAELLGVTRSRVNRALRDLATEDVITLGYGSIEVTDPSALAALLD